MDFKGIRWVGNVYQKFEAMCLEVEEIIVQDTAKYVETQVQTVGTTVKKFCSDVVQDFLPDDSVGLGKTLPDSMLHEYAPVCSFKKKRESMDGKTRGVKQDEVSAGKKDGCEMKFRGLDADDYDICTSPRLDSYGGPYRRTRPGRKQIIKKDEFFQITRPYIRKDSSSLSLVHSTRVKDDVRTVSSSDSPPGEVERLTSKEECQKDDRTKKEHGLTVVHSVLSQDSEIRTKNEQGLKVVCSVSNQDSDIQASVATSFSLSAGSNDHTKETDEDSMETSSSSVSEQKLEMLQQLSGRSVEESCILLDRDEFPCVFPVKGNVKQKPYKKIRDAISSRMKHNREKEYKQLARQWNTEDVESWRGCGDIHKPLEENRSSEESEWELL